MEFFEHRHQIERTLHIVEEISRQLEKLAERVKEIERLLETKHHFTIQLTQENTMAIGSLSSPGTASILLALLDNGSPYVPPAGSTYTFAPTLTSSDTLVTITADPTVPDQFDVTIPAGDTSTSVTFTASATAPDGTTASGTLSIPFASTPQQFSISVTQSA